MCGKTFGKKNHVARHINAVHLNVRPWVCGVCGFPFQEKRGLARHLKVHERREVAGFGIIGQASEYQRGIRREYDVITRRGDMVGVGFGRRRWGSETGVGNGVEITNNGGSILVGDKVVKRHVISTIEELAHLKGY